MNRMKLIRKIATDCGYHEDVVKEIFDYTFSTILAHTAEGGSINIHKFGKFKRYTSKSGVSRLEFMPGSTTTVDFKKESIEDEINRLRHIKW